MMDGHRNSPQARITAPHTSSTSHVCSPLGEALPIRCLRCSGRGLSDLLAQSFARPSLCVSPSNCKQYGAIVFMRFRNRWQFCVGS